MSEFDKEKYFLEDKIPKQIELGECEFDADDIFYCYELILKYKSKLDRLEKALMDRQISESDHIQND